MTVLLTHLGQWILDKTEIINAYEIKWHDKLHIQSSYDKLSK